MNIEKSSIDLDSLISLLATYNQLRYQRETLIKPQLLDDTQTDLSCEYLKLKSQLDCKFLQISKLKEKMEYESKVNYSLKEKIKLRREKLNEKINRLSDCREELVVRNREVCQTRIIAEDHVRLTKKCLSKVARDLSFIYNIQRDSRNLTLFHIRGCALNNNIYQDLSPSICIKFCPLNYCIDPEFNRISVGIGYCTHLIIMLATYLNVDLRYPLIFCGSKSFVLDLINVELREEERKFPLYLEKNNQLDFDYGLFLLNKNVEQLLQSQGLTALDLRNTLPNLKWLLQTLQSVKPF